MRTGTPRLASGNMVTLEFRDVRKVYPGPVAALAGLSFAAPPGEVTAVVGPSGSGKTTALRILAGLEPATSGSVALDGAPIDRLSPRARDVALVLQQPALVPHLSVEKNLEFPLRLRGAPPADRRSAAREIAELLHLTRHLSKFPSELSGGEAQRVALGRALIRRPRCLLLDEPFASLDGPLREELREVLRTLLRRRPTTTLLVTHDADEALSLGNRLAVLRRGTLEQYDAPETVYAAPRNRHVARSVGAPPMNLLHGRILLAEGRLWCELAGAKVALAEWAGRRLASRIGERAIVGIRPEALSDRPWPMFFPGASRIEVTVASRVWLGRWVHVTGSTDLGDRVLAALAPPAHYAAGERLPLYVDVSRLHLFSAGESGENLLA